MVEHRFSEEEKRTAKAVWWRMFFVEWFGDISCEYDRCELFTFATFGGERYLLYRAKTHG